MAELSDIVFKEEYIEVIFTGEHKDLSTFDQDMLKIDSSLKTSNLKKCMINLEALTGQFRESEEEVFQDILKLYPDVKIAFLSHEGLESFNQKIDLCKDNKDPMINCFKDRQKAESWLKE